MKLFYSPGACSLASHIILEESGLPYQTEKVNLKDKTCSSGSYWMVNPHGKVPALELEDGGILTENAVIMQYVASLAPGLNLIPPAPSKEHWRCLERINFIATDIHKGFGPLFNAEHLMPGSSQNQETLKASTRQILQQFFQMLEKDLGRRTWQIGEHFGLPDAYLFVMLTWAQKTGVQYGEGLKALQGRVADRAAVQRVLAAEELLPKVA